MDFTAVVFDMDGVIYDSEQAFINCWKEVANRYGIEGIEEVCHKCLGTNYAQTRAIMLEHYGEDFPLDERNKEIWALFRERYGDGKLPMKPGVLELLQALKCAGKKIALASSTKEADVRQELGDAGILTYFDQLVCGDMVRKSKPEPDIYLKACEVIGVDPQSAYAIEDSFNGIRSAHAAGLHAIMVPDILQPTEEIRAVTETVLNSLHEVRTYLLKE